MKRPDSVTELQCEPGVIDVRLPETPSSGYRWALSNATSGAELVGDRYLEAEPQPVAGGSGEHTFRIYIDEPGRYELDFRLKRPWEEDELERAVFVVTVTPAAS